MKMLTKKQKEEKKEIIKRINNHRQSKTFGWILAIFTFWTFFGLIAGVWIIVHHDEKVRKLNQRLVDFE